LEDRLNTFLVTKSQDKHVGRVVVRVVNIRNKTFNVNKETLEYYQEKGEPFPNELCYRSKALFVFQKQKGYDVCFFGCVLCPLLLVGGLTNTLLYAPRLTL
jgi:hypothetical protein